MTDDNQSAADANSPLPDDMAQYLQVYLDESEEELEELVEAILTLEKDPRHADSLNRAFRMLHSLKGSSGMLGFEVVGNFAHELEDRFERYRSGLAILDRETTTLFLKCIDYFRAFLNRLRSSDHTQSDPASFLEQLRSLEHRGSEKPTTAQSSTPPSPAMTLSGGVNVIVRFRQGLQLADLKARLIVARLSSIGEIVSCEPAIDDVHSFDDLSIFSLTLLTDRNLDEVRKIANVDGVESVDIQGRELTTNLLSHAVAEAVVEPLPPPTASLVEQPLAPAEPIVTAEAISTRKLEAEPAEEKLQSSETLRVDIGRLDHLMNLTGELVVANARFSQISNAMTPLIQQSSHFKKSKELADRLRQRFDSLRQQLAETDGVEDMLSHVAMDLDEDLNDLDRHAELWSEGHHHFAEIRDAVDQLTRVSKNLQRGVLNTRMVPIGPLFNRFKRVVRDLSVGRGKQVQLVIQGEKTELDKRMIDALGDPLLHLVRNSIDHGLETPEQRRAAGKSEGGTVTLSAAHRGNSVWITVRDDGAGINIQKILKRIVERGLATAAQAADMTEPQAIGYIWHPGFSTAEAVTEISGRGVGMDIVHNAISELSGTIDVASLPGSGTTFTIRLPLTLAIIHSLIMRFRDGYFSIPIDEVREIVSVPRSQVHKVHRYTTIDVRGELIPLVSMKGVFEWNSGPKEKDLLVTNSGTEKVNVVVIHSRSKTLGLTVDALVGRADLVIKSLSDNFQPMRGLSGASILGDGDVCLMLDSAALVDLAAERSHVNYSASAI